MATSDASGAAHKRAFLEFIDQAGYVPHVEAMLKANGKRLSLSLDALRNFDASLAANLLRRPAEFLPPFEEALREYVQSQDAGYSKVAPLSQIKIGVTGAFGSHHVSPRGLTATLLNSLVTVEGIVTKCTVVRPKVSTSVHYCPATAKFSSKEYRDLTSLGGAPATGSAYPTKDADGNRLETEYGMCEYTDHQLISLQEMPERAPPGQLPRSIDVILEGDLCDLAKPGDRVLCSGIHRALPSKANQSGMFKTVLLANSCRMLTRELASDGFTREDLENIRSLAKQRDVLSQLSRSLAPSICGHEHEKVALLLMLLGGSEKNLANGTHLRGDVNILMLGDPSTAKSQLLRFVLRIAPLAVSTTGRGSSGVGLTAAVTKDDDTGDRRLEAGAMVLADRGVCCVDEFDKMTDADRVAIHEVNCN
jgi:DNA replication licensing factor MCM3